VRGADSGAGEHRDDCLGDHRQIYGDPVALGHPEVQQRVRGPLHLGEQVGVGDVAGVTGLAHEVDGYLVAATGLDVAVDAVVRGVQLSADEPLGKRRIAPVEGLVEVLAPGQV